VVAIPTVLRTVFVTTYALSFRHICFNSAILQSRLDTPRRCIKTSNWMRAFIVTMSALGIEDVLTVGSLCNNKWTRIINFPHTLLCFRTVGLLGLLFFDRDLVDDVTCQHPICILRNSTGGRRMRIFDSFFFLIFRR